MVLRGIVLRPDAAAGHRGRLSHSLRGSFLLSENVARDRNRATIENFDVVLIATNHSSVNYREFGVGDASTRNAIASIFAPGKVWKA